MERALKDKTVLVTGGAEGIGFEIAEKYLSNGAKIVILLDINENLGTKAVESLTTKYGNSKVAFFKCDVTQDLDLVSKNIIKKYGNVDVLVNSAGVVDESSAKKTIGINLQALMEWTMKFREHMRTDKGGRGGTIINIASIYGLKTDPFLPFYQASKHAVVAFTRSLGHEDSFKKFGVRVVAICPGFTATKLANGLQAIDPQLQADFEEFAKGSPWQNVDAVGKAAVEIFDRADSGTVWVIVGNKPVAEALSYNKMYDELQDALLDPTVAINIGSI